MIGLICSLKSLMTMKGLAYIEGPDPVSELICKLTSY